MLASAHKFCHSVVSFDRSIRSIRAFERSRTAQTVAERKLMCDLYVYVGFNMIYNGPQNDTEKKGCDFNVRIKSGLNRDKTSFVCLLYSVQCLFE